jgi:hypothetical protein
MSVRSRSLKASVLRIRIARLFVVLVLILLVGGFEQAQAAGITLVQHIGKDAGTTTTSTLAFPGANTVGNFIAVVIRGGLSNSQVFSVKDSNSNAYKQAVQLGSSGSAVTSAIYYAENIAGGANTITVTMTVSGPLRFAILEYSGVATANSPDAVAAASATSTSPNSGNLTMTVSGDLLLGEVATADSTTFTGGAGFAVRDFVPAEPNTKLITEDQIQAMAGTVSASATLNPSSNWAALLAAFKPAGGVAGTPASITATAGTPQSATVNTAFGIQFQATVKDSFNNPVTGATITFTAPGSGASGTFAGGVTTATTNASGLATAAVFTANTTDGAYTVTATVSGVPSPANFSLTNLAGAAASITSTAGTPQSAPVNTAFATQLQATVKDSFNNPVSGATVTFAAPGSGASGTFAGGVNTATTNALGVAVAAVFTANTAAGSYLVTASVSGLGTSASFSLTNLAGPAASITATAGTPQSAPVNTAFGTQLQATVKDSFNNPVSGATVTFAAPNSGASGTFVGGVSTTMTNASGVATAAVFTANTTAGGPYTVTASVSGVASPASFSLTNLAGAAVTIAATTGTPQSASISTAFAVQLQATVKDSFGNPVSGVTVTFTAPGSGASGTFAGGVNTATTNASGIATAPVFTANATAGGPYAVTASALGVASPANFSLTNVGNPPANIAATAGTPQSATINTAFAAQLQVTVTDSGNNPVSGVTVTFAAPGSGASGTFAGGVNTATTNASGVATSVIFTANSVAGGPYTVSATVSGVASPANFSLTNLTGAAASITATAGTPQSATVGAAYATQFQATVKDAGGNPVNGVTVTFAAPGSGASGTFAGGVNTATTNALGVATAAVFTANTTAGAYIVTASVAGVASPANFSLTNLAGTAASIAATAGTPQNATVNTAFAAQLQATVKDSLNNPVSGVTVTFTAPGSGASGTFAGGVNTATTNASGIATASAFTANSVAGGPYTVTASVSGVASPANFSLNNLAGSAASLAATAGTPQSATVNTAFTTLLQATVKDSFNNPVSGVTVTFTAPTSGASGTFAGGVNTATTNSSGVATSAVFTANSTAGAYTVTASVSSVANPANFSLTNLAGAAASMTATAGTPQSATVSTAFAVQLQAAVKDSLNNPVSGLTVTFTAPTSGPSGTFAGGINTATTNASGLATAPVFTANSATGTYTVTASATGSSAPANFSLTNLGNPPANIAATAGTPQSATVNTAFATQLQVTVTDSGNNPVAGVTVTFNAPSSGASGTFAGSVNTATTNASGVATSPVFTANSTAGAYTAMASVSGISTPANFSLTNLAGTAASITATAGTPQSATVGTAFATQLQATVTDSFNNPVSGVTLTFTAPSSGASGTFGGGVNAATTNASGVATAPVFTANSVAGGPYTVTASVPGVASPSNFSLTNLASVAAPIALVQHKGIDAGTTTTATLAFASANTAGNFIAVVIRGGNSNAQVFTVRDSNSNTYKQAKQLASSGSAVTSAIYYAENVRGGANTVTVTMTVSGPLRFAILEYSGVATSNSLDAAIAATTTSTSPNSGNLTTTANGDLLLGDVATADSDTYTGGTGFTIRDLVPAAPSTKLVTEDQVQSAAGTTSAFATLSVSSNWAAILAAFKPATGGGGAGTPASIAATAGATQSATVNTAFAAPLQATVKDSLNNPVSGVTVTFTAPGSGASGTFVGGVNTATTNASGVATSAVFTANTVAGGPYTITASVSGVSTPANFSLTNSAGGASSITATVGTPQSATINTAFATQLQATVRDFFNNPVSGVTVTFTAPGSGASGTFAGGVNAAITNASGVAIAAVFTANGATGSYTVAASASGVATMANFSLTNVSAPPASITATAGTPQSATVNTAFTTAFQTTVKDASNSPVSGATVTFTAPASGASGAFAGGVNMATTNSLGVATSAVFTANATAGSYTLTASVSGVATPANFSLTNLAGSAANITATAGTPQSAVINTAFAAPLQATVTDSLNNPVSGITVMFTAPAGGASGTFAGGVNTATTNAQGIATASAFTANSTVGGPYTVTASASGVTAQVNFSLTNLSAAGNIALVQHRNIDASTATSNSLAFATNTTSGNFIAVCIRAGGSSSQVFTVTDSSGNTYRQAFKKGLVNTVETFAIYYAENIIGGPDAIHVQQSVNASLRFIILEYSGVATSNSLDGTVSAEGSNATPSSGNLATTANGDLLLATMMTKNIAVFTAHNGFTIEEAVQASPNTRLIAEDQLQSIAGTVSASASIPTSDNWGAGLAAFRSISGSVAPISVSVSPGSGSLPSGYGAQAFAATVTNDFLNRGVTWSLSGAGCSGAACGSLSRVTTTSVTYIAPSNIPSPATLAVTATSIGDTTKSASATITVTQGVLTVVLNPKRAAVTLASPPVQFAANVYNDPQNLGVTWQVDGNNGGTSASGTISATGLYTPGTQPGAHTVTAVSNANASVTGSALVAVTDLTGVYTHHNDNSRTGQNLKEYGLTPSIVNSGSFGQLFSCPVDGNIYAQPLWVASLNFGGTTRNAVFVATEHDSVYAFDADSPSCVQLWKMNFLSSGVTTLTPADVASNNDFYPEIGITSTPVIDPATNTLYVVPETRETVGTVNGQACSTGTPCYVHRLHALDLFTGAEKFGGPVVITGANFNSQKHLQRPALLLANNTLYLAFGSHGDQCPYQGWVMGYNPSTLAQTFAKALSDPTSGCNQGAIWLSGGGPSADANGNVYVVTANGLYDGNLNFGDTVAKLSPTGSLLDWFTPFNQATLAANDVDLGSSAVLILPDSVGSTAHPHLALTMGKTAVVYLLDQANLGKFNSSVSNDVQEVIPVPPMNTTMDDGGNYVGPAYWNGNIYVTGQNYPLSQFQISNGVISTPQAATSSNTFPPRGGAPVVSANGTTAGVVWIIDYTGFQNNTAAILYAYDAANVGTLLYSSSASGSGAAGNGVKFTVPTVANSKVYVGGQLSFTVYGLLPN